MSCFTVLKRCGGAFFSGLILDVLQCRSKQTLVCQWLSTTFQMMLISRKWRGLADQSFSAAQHIVWDQCRILQLCVGQRVCVAPGKPFHGRSARVGPRNDHSRARILSSSNTDKNRQEWSFPVRAMIVDVWLNANKNRWCLTKLVNHTFRHSINSKWKSSMHSA